MIHIWRKKLGKIMSSFAGQEDTMININYVAYKFLLRLSVVFLLFQSKQVLPTVSIFFLSFIFMLYEQKI